MNEERQIFVVADTQADFMRPARLNDGLLVISHLISLARTSLLIKQQIFRHSLNGALLYLGTPRAAILHADTLKPVRVPVLLFEGSSS